MCSSDLLFSNPSLHTLHAYKSSPSTISNWNRSSIPSISSFSIIEHASLLEGKLFFSFSLTATFFVSVVFSVRSIVLSASIAVSFGAFSSLSALTGSMCFLFLCFLNVISFLKLHSHVSHFNLLFV